MKQKRIIDYLMVILALFLTLSVCFFFANKKAGMYEDEVVTYGLANSHYATWISDIKDEYVGGDMTEHIVSRQDFLSYLAVDKGERFDFASVYINQSHDVHPPLYYELLNIFCSFKINSFSKWPGLILNIILYMFSVLFLYRCLDEMFNNKTISVCAVLFYALSFFGLSNMLFIRMYILLTLMTILLTYEIIRFLKDEKTNHYIKIAFIVLGGMLTQYNFVFYAFFITLFAFIYLLSKKKIKNAFKIGLSSFVGVCALFVCYPFFFKQIKEGANGGTVSGESTIKKFLNIRGWFDKIKLNMEILTDGLSVALFIIKVLLVIIVCFFVVYLIFKFKKNNNLRDVDKMVIAFPVLIIISSILSFSFIAVTIPGPSSRYFYHLVPFIAILIGWEFYIVSYLWKKIFNEEKIKKIVFYCAVVASVLCNLKCLQNRYPEFLFSDFSTCFEKILKYESAPCIYVDAGYLLRVHDETLQFLIKSNDVYITKQDNLNSASIKKYVDEHKDTNDLLLYIDGDIGDKNYVVDSLMNGLQYTNQEFLYATQRSTIIRIYK